MNKGYKMISNIRFHGLYRLSNLKPEGLQERATYLNQQFANPQQAECNDTTLAEVTGWDKIPAKAYVAGDKQDIFVLLINGEKNQQLCEEHTILSYVAQKLIPGIKNRKNSLEDVQKRINEAFSHIPYQSIHL